MTFIIMTLLISIQRRFKKIHVHIDQATIILNLQKSTTPQRDLTGELGSSKYHPKNFPFYFLTINLSLLAEYHAHKQTDLSREMGELKF